MILLAGDGGWETAFIAFFLFFIGAIIWAVLFPFRLGTKKITCPKCSTRVVPQPRYDRKRGKGGNCPRCGDWFPESTWEQMANPGAV